MDQPNIVNSISSKIKNVYVTSLRISYPFILAGQGGDVHIFDTTRKVAHKPEKICSLEVFSSQSIQGIVEKADKCLVYGGRNVSLLAKGAENYKSVHVIQSWTAEDWILDGLWSENSTIILLTAHNVVLEYEVSPVKLVSKVVCVERCILYSGKLFGPSLSDIVVIAGTVYQEVIIWTPSKDEIISDVPVHQRLQGHKGVIFCTAYDELSHCIASTSDDRTVRVWSVKFDEDSQNVCDKWSRAKINLSFTAFGHSARVWRCIFTDSKNLVTVGEDSFICLWDKNGLLLNKWEHSGEIWAVDCHRDCLAIGGNGITVRSLSSFPEITSISISDFGSPRSLVLNAYGSTIIFSDTGCLVQGGINSEPLVIFDERFKSYCVLSNSPCRNYIARGSICGDIVFYKVDKDGLVKLCEIFVKYGRVYSLCWSDEKSFVSCGENGSLSVVTIVYTNDLYKLEVTHDLILPPSKERWITCALIIAGFLICGDRMGSLHLYLLSSDCKGPVDSYSKLHGTKGVSDVKFLNGILYSTGRDGTLRELEIGDNELKLISTLKLPMDWTSSLLQPTAYGLLIAGFHDVNFVLWSVSERVTLLQLECGGGHRSFDYMIDDGSGNLILAFIRMKEVKYLSHPIKNLSHQTVLSSYHTKSINCACLLQKDKDCTTVVTAGEDNSLRTSSFDEIGWHNLCTYVRHISAVRAVKSIGDLVVSGGARAQIIIWSVKKTYSGEIHLKELNSHMLRDESEQRRSWKDAKPLIDPETRIMDLEICKNTDDNLMIFGACSDGMLRLFDYIVSSNELTLRRSVDSGQSCLLKLSSYQWEGGIGIVSGGTKGSVAFWRPPFEVKPSRPHFLHPMGVNAMDCFVSGNNVILGTGGDDSSVALTVFSLHHDKLEDLTFNIVEHVHTCQVSGLKITSDYMISASLDQKVCVFQWKLDGDYLKTFLIGLYVTSVPDIHGILTWGCNNNLSKNLNVLVFGCGFQLINFNGSMILQ